MEKRDYAYLMAGLEGFPPLLLRRLLGLYGSPEQVMKQKSLPLSPAQQAAFDRAKAEQDQRLKRRDAAEKEGIRWCWFEEDIYPARLKNLEDAPLGLFWKGRLPPDEKPSTGIVGARRCSPYGRAMAERFGGELGARGISVISGMALGIDGAAQRAALKGGGASFGILGCGVDICYPATHRDLYEMLIQGGGILSELPPGMPPLPHHFPMRNRLIAAFSDVLLVLEAREKSGSFITVDQALEQGKEVLALPGRLGDELSAGCLQLIRQGAGLLSCCGDIYQLLNMEEEKESDGRRRRRRLPPELEKIWRLTGTSPRHVEAMMEEGGLELGPLSLGLLELESMGLVKQVAGGSYLRT